MEKGSSNNGGRWAVCSNFYVNRTRYDHRYQAEEKCEELASIDKDQTYFVVEFVSSYTTSVVSRTSYDGRDKFGYKQHD